MTEAISYSIRYMQRQTLAKSEIVELARVKNLNYQEEEPDSPAGQGGGAAGGGDDSEHPGTGPSNPHDSDSESPLLQARGRTRSTTASSAREDGQGEERERARTVTVSRQPGQRRRGTGRRHKGETPYHFVKIISRAGGEIAQSYFDNEIRVMHNIRHPRISYLVDFGVDERHWYIVTEYYGGDTLEKRIVTKGTVREAIAAQYTRQLLSALRVLHWNNITHRDLQAKHVIFEEESELSDLRLVGFQHAAHLADSSIVLDSPEGNLQYLSPELLENTYTRNGATWKASDIWAVGVMVYWMVSGKYPFAAEDNISTKQSIRLASPPMGSDFSEELKDFLKQLLTEIAPRRPTAEVALTHPWITKYVNPEEGTEDLKLVEALKLKERNNCAPCREACTTCGLM